MTSTENGPPVARPRVDQAFRTPIALILADIETLLTDAHPGSDAASRLRTAQRNALRLLNLVDGMMTIDKHEEGRLRMRYGVVDVSARTLAILKRLEAVAARSGVRIESDVEPGCVGRMDGDAWDRVVLNLMANALKLTFEGRIAVRLHRADDMIVLKIVDDGLGLDKDGLESAIASRRGDLSAEIGLGVVKATVEALHGTMDARSAAGHGTAIVVRIPFGEANAAMDVPRPPAERDAVSDFLIAAERWTQEEAEPAPSSAALRWRDPQRSRVAVITPDDEVASLVERSLPDGVDFVVLDDIASIGDREADLWIVPEGLTDEAKRLLVSRSGMRLLLVEGTMPDDLSGFDEILRLPFSLASARLRIDGLLSRARLERQLAEAREHAVRLDSMARIVSGTSHDFSNLLVAALGNLDMAARHAEGELAVYVMNAKRAAERGARLTRHLLAFSQGGTGRSDVVNVNEAISAVAEFLTTVLGGMIGMSMVLGRDVPAVAVPGSRFELALVNMALIARDSIGGNGHFRIATDCVGSGADRSASISVVAVGNAGGDVVHHDGLISSLEQVASFASANGGRLETSLPLTGGAVLTLVLPGTAEAKVEAGDLVASDASEMALRILVADDDAGVREVAVTLLEELGHSVVLAAGGREAVGILEQQEFDLLMTDFAMPDMTGLDVAARARALHPGMAIMIATGYADSALLDERDEVVLRKPFGIDELKAKVAEAMVARRAPADAKVTPLFGDRPPRKD